MWSLVNKWWVYLFSQLPAINSFFAKYICLHFSSFVFFYPFYRHYWLNEHGSFNTTKNLELSIKLFKKWANKLLCHHSNWTKFPCYTKKHIKCLYMSKVLNSVSLFTFKHSYYHLVCSVNLSTYQYNKDMIRKQNSLIVLIFLIWLENLSAKCVNNNFIVVCIVLPEIFNVMI